jgi:3'(2'), 5'-bisphosphate nucleotidase
MFDNCSELKPAELLPQVLEVARRAGKAIMTFYNDLNPTIQWKQNMSPLTHADLTSHRVICDGLAAISPRFPVLSEESADIPYEVRRTWEDFWLVDPLDGTKEFLKRSGQFTVNIALISGGIPILGVIYVPASDEMYFAAEGSRACKAQHGIAVPIKVAAARNPTLKVVVSITDDGGMSQLRVDLEKIGIDANQCEFSPMGSSLKFCLVADGSADIYLRNGPTMEWDTAAAQCVLEIAGGTVSDLDGNRLGYNKPILLNPSFLASATRLAPWVI